MKTLLRCGLPGAWGGRQNCPAAHVGHHTATVLTAQRERDFRNAGPHNGRVAINSHRFI